MTLKQPIHWHPKVVSLRHLKFGLNLSLKGILCAGLLAGLIPLTLLGAPVHCGGDGMAGAWFSTASEKVLRPTWNTPVQGEAQDFPAPDPEGSGPIIFELLYDGASSGTISTDFNNYLDVEIWGLSLGQTVLLERFLVDNDQGIINQNAVLMDSRLITDGELRRVGGKVNFNEVMDYYEIAGEAFTDRDGVIYSYFPLRDGFEVMPGEYVYRVSSPQDSFTAQTERLTIVEATEAQYYSGRVKTAAGDPVPGAVVGLLQPVGGYSHLKRVTVADANGDYTLYAPFSDEFDLVAVAPGFVGPFAVGTDRFIGEGDVISQDLQLTAGTRTLSGTVVDAVTSEPIAGLPMTFMTTDASGVPDDRLFTQTWTDDQGQFSVAATAETWGVTFKPGDVSSRSYMTNAEQLLKIVDLSAGDASNVEVALTRGTSLIAGTLASAAFTNASGDPLPIEGVEVFAINFDNNRAVSGRTYEDGWFNLAVTPGHWVVFPFSFDLELARHPGSTGYPVYFSGPNQSVELDIPVPYIGGVLEGFATDDQFDPVGRLRFVAVNEAKNYDESVIQTTYASDGYYNFYLAPGSWLIFPDAESAVERDLLFADLPRVYIPETGDPFSDNSNYRPIDVVEPTGTIEVTVVDELGNPVPDIKMHGMMLGGDGVFYDNFGKTNAAGVAVMPARDGDWQIHLSIADLRNAGFRELPVFDVTLAGATVAVPQTVEAFDASEIEMTLDPQGLTGDGSEFYLTGRGEPGRRYVVEGSNDLESWSFLGHVSAIEGEFSIFDTVKGALEQTDPPSSSVFYRLKTEN